jgi:hypothetical protein
MRRLPLFPLPLVLFPGGRAPLHIFEPRYRRMVARCLEYDRQFGLLFHDADRMGPFDCEPGRMGTVAEIEDFQILPDGRSLLVAHGRERFRIVDGIEGGTPYVEALVEPVEDELVAASLGLEREQTLELLDRLLRQGPSAEGGSGFPSEPEEDFTLSADPTPHPTPDPTPHPTPRPLIDPTRDHSFQIAALLQVDPMWQQALLMLNREDLRLRQLRSLFLEALGPEMGS